MTSEPDLATLGWTPFFADQLDGNPPTDSVPARVMAVHRGYLTVVGPGVDQMIPAYIADADDEEAFATAGDWLLLDPETRDPVRILGRKSLFKRRAPGAGRGLQLLAANVDTLFIVTSCNLDFNIPRLERYLVLAHDAGVTPVIVLTKADLADDPRDFLEPVRALQPGLLVEIVDARDPESAACLGAWCAHGQTVALLGSSGVGKSTLVNTLIGEDAVATRDIRESDDKGRHTTTGRGLYRLPHGGWLLDTPGMRELQLADAAVGVGEVFEDILALASECRFNDCVHESEPGCAVKAAVEGGALDADRVERWRKLAAEEALNTETLAQRRVRDRSLGKMYRSAQRRKRDRDSD